MYSRKSAGSIKCLRPILMNGICLSQSRERIAHGVVLSARAASWISNSSGAISGFGFAINNSNLDTPVCPRIQLLRQNKETALSAGGFCYLLLRAITVWHRRLERCKPTHLREAWATAVVAAEMPGLLVHDLRRSAIRNLIAAGVPEKVAMSISGHKTRAVFDRYHIVDSADVVKAMGKLQNSLTKPKTVRV